MQNNLNSTSEKYDLWGRVGCVEIDLGRNSSYNQGKPLRFTDVDFSFKVTKVMGDYQEGSVDVRILGLKQDTMNQIVTICNQVEALASGKRIRVYAGYQDMGEGDKNYFGDKIIEADISYAKVDSPAPEMWLSIVGVIGYRNQFQQINVSFPDKITQDEYSKPPQKKYATQDEYHIWDGFVFLFDDYGYEYAGSLSNPFRYYKYKEVQKDSPPTILFKDLCQKCVEILNVLYNANGKIGAKVELDFRTENNPKIENFTSQGTISDMLSALRQVGDFYVFLDCDRDAQNLEHLVVCDRPKDVGVDNIQQEINRFKKQVRIKHLSKKTGMIGIPSVANATSLECRMLLDPRLTVGDYIDLESQTMPSANDKNWQITRITHTGRLRGSEWYTDVVCENYVRLNANQKAQEEVQKNVDLAIKNIDASIGISDGRQV